MYPVLKTRHISESLGEEVSKKGNFLIVQMMPGFPELPGNFLFKGLDPL
jgi:hypothetical protein